MQINTLTTFGIGGLAADAVVHGEARVSPLAHAMSEVGSEGALIAQEIEYFVAQRLPRKCRHPVRTDISKAAICISDIDRTASHQEHRPAKQPKEWQSCSTAATAAACVRITDRNRAIDAVIRRVDVCLDG